MEGQEEYFKTVEPDINEVLLRRSSQLGPEVELNDLLACDRFDIMDQVHKIQLPTQVVCGSLDAMTPVKYSDYLTKEITGARQGIISGGNHFVQLEKYHQVNAQIEQFLATLK